MSLSVRVEDALACPTGVITSTTAQTSPTNKAVVRAKVTFISETAVCQWQGCPSCFASWFSVNGSMLERWLNMLVTNYELYNYCFSEIICGKS